MNTESSQTKFQHSSFLVLFLGVGGIMFFILQPFLSALIFALAFSVVFNPLYRRISHKLNDRRSLASLITIVIIVVAVLAPLILIGSLLFNEAGSLYESIALNGGADGIANNLTMTFEKYVHRVAPDVTIDVAAYIQYGLQWVVGHLSGFFTGFLSVILSIFIMVLALFYLLKDGGALRTHFIALSPLPNKYDEEILEKLSRAVNSVIRGSLVIAVIQGMLAAIGVWIVGIPNPIIIGALATIASLIPGVGTFLVMFPVIMYMFVVRDIGPAIGLAVWQTCVVGLIDNALAPFILNRGLKIHSFFILLSVLGGIAFFGPIGFLLGPLMLSLFFALLDIYPLILKKDIN